MNNLKEMGIIIFPKPLWEKISAFSQPEVPYVLSALLYGRIVYNPSIISYVMIFLLP